MYFDQYAPDTVPTWNDRWDVDLPSITSDIRAIVNGTLHARSWGDIASTWYHKPAPRERKPRISSKERRPNIDIRRLTRILVSNGMESNLALQTARELLIKGKN